MCASPIITTIRPGDTTKTDPFTVVIVSNPALEAPWKSGNFVIDPITSMQVAFNAAVAQIDSALFGLLPGQRERFIADPAIAPKIRVVSVFVSGLPAQDSNSLVGEDGVVPGRFKPEPPQLRHTAIEFVARERTGRRDDRDPIA